MTDAVFTLVPTPFERHINASWPAGRPHAPWERYTDYHDHATGESVSREEHLARLRAQAEEPDGLSM